jgi:hypothetical protein
MKRAFFLGWGQPSGQSIGWLWLAAIGQVFLLWRYVVKDLLHPLSGGGDNDYWEYTGYYFGRHLTLLPLPHIDLHTDVGFYPYGVNQVFQPWSLERDLFYGTFSTLFGPGGWLQLYYLLSNLLILFGVFYLLRRDYGFGRSLLAGWLMSSGAFYTVLKYPHHLCYAIAHWTILSFVVDFLLLKRCALGQRISLQLVLLRILLLVLSLSQELGYVAGYSLMSFTVSIVWLLGTLLVRQRQFGTMGIQLRGLCQQWQQECQQRRGLIVGLVAAIVICTWFYVPIVGHIVKNAKLFDFGAIKVGVWWASPWRFLIPIFPDTVPTPFWADQWLGDNHEANAAGTPGWFFLGFAGAGLWALRRQRRLMMALIPLVTMLVSMIVYHPIDFPTLKVFPWFEFNRVGSRVTIAYPVILTLIGIHAAWPQWSWSQWSRRQWSWQAWVSGLLALILVVETGTAYGWKDEFYQTYQLDQQFWQYIAAVKAQPGEAVLDFPFCVAGGNGLTEGMCPFFKRTASNFTFQRFHGKKVLGQYFGRLHPTQVPPLVQSGWTQMFPPTDLANDLQQAKTLTRCLDDRQWRFLESFYTLNDFAGINLYPDLLLPECVNQFHQRFGQPIQVAKVPWPGGVGRVEFIPKQKALRDRVDLVKGRQVKLSYF